MAKWKIKIEGFAYIEADSWDEAIELHDKGKSIYEEYGKTGEKVNEFPVNNFFSKWNK